MERKAVSQMRCKSARRLEKETPDEGLGGGDEVIRVGLSRMASQGNVSVETSDFRLILN